MRKRIRLVRFPAREKDRPLEEQPIVEIRWLTVRQISIYLQISVAKVYQMAQDGEIPCCRLGQQWRFDRDEIDRWLRGLRSRFD